MGGGGRVMGGEGRGKNVHSRKLKDYHTHTQLLCFIVVAAILKFIMKMPVTC